MSAADLAGHIEAVAKALYGEPNKRLSNKDELRFGNNGSLRVSVMGDHRGTWKDHESGAGGGVLDLIAHKNGCDRKSAAAWLRENIEGEATTPPPSRAVATYRYEDESGQLIHEVVRLEPKSFRQRRPDGRGGHIWNMKGVPPTLYNLPRVRAAAMRGDLVFVVEGEKDADRLNSLGLVATCNAGGAGKWHPDHTEQLVGAQVAIIPDNDEAGHAHAEKVALSCHERRGAPRIIDLHLTHQKADVSDWLAAGGTADDLLAMFDKAAPFRPHIEDGSNVHPFVAPGEASFNIIDPSCWQGQEPPAREWMLDGWLPRRRAAYITGAGGAGKSLLGQQLATCIALGEPLFGIATQQAPAIYLTAEDDADELQRRQRAICRTLGTQEANLRGTLFHISLFGQTANEMVTFDREDGMQTTPAWKKLVNAARMTGAKFIVLDNVSHLFAGNEIDRSQVTAFANLLNSLALEIDGTVLLIGHPNKSGDAYSGSTAWENAFRARLYFDAPKDDHAHTDPDARRLSLPKANYARKGSAIDVRWHEGALILDGDDGPSPASQLRDIGIANAENEAFLRCLDKATSDRRAFSHVPGVNYAPKRFAEMVEGSRFDQEAFRRAMERLIHLGEIELDQPLWQGKNRHWKQGIRRAKGVGANQANSLKSFAPTPAPTSCANPAPSVTQVIENTCANPAPLVRANPLSPTGIYTPPHDGGDVYPLGSEGDDDLDWGTGAEDWDQ